MPYRDAQAALIAALAEHARPGHTLWQDQFDPAAARMVGKERLMDAENLPPAMPRFDTGLHGMEEICSEAAYVWKQLERMNRDRVAVMVMRCPPTTQHPGFLWAWGYLTEVSVSQVTGITHYQARRHSIRSLMGGRWSQTDIAQHVNVHQSTISRVFEKLRPWLDRLEEQAWADFRDRLESRGLIG